MPVDRIANVVPEFLAAQQLGPVAPDLVTVNGELAREPFREAVILGRCMADEEQPSQHDRRNYRRLVGSKINRNTCGHVPPLTDEIPSGGECRAPRHKIWWFAPAFQEHTGNL